MKRTTCDDLVEYVWQDCRGGPVLGPVLEGIALSRFGVAPTTLTARLRELRQGGHLGQIRAKMGSGNRTYVAYTCTADQYHHYTVIRAGAATGAGHNPPVRATVAAPMVSEDEQTSLGDWGEPPNSYQRGA